jgi:hypothetical protein
MEKKLLVVLVVVGLCSTAALALDPMGPATAGLKQGKFSAGVDYAYSQMDLQYDGDYSFYVENVDIYGTLKDKFKLKDTQMHKAYFNLGYGVCDSVEAFVRLGVANLYAKQKARGVEDYYAYDVWFDPLDYDSDTGFAVGFGGKVTFWEPSPECKVGFLAQASWASVDYDMTMYGYADGADADFGADISGELDFWEVQLALGVTYQLAPSVSIYGGPFYYWFSGDYDYDASGWWWADWHGDYEDMTREGSYDVEDEGCFGGYVGVQFAATENISFNAECQGAKGALVLGTGMVWKF